VAVENGSPSAHMFQDQWRIYRKVVDNNYLFHREAYECLSRVLKSEVGRPFHIVDIACGDASATVAALRGTSVARYTGIDLSRPALALAAENLAAAPYPFQLHHADFRTGLADVEGSIEVVWIGLSLHHLKRNEKLGFMQVVRSRLAEGGLLVLYENAGPNGDTREEWMDRWDGQRPDWHAFDAQDWQTITAHVHEFDFPETSAVWHDLGRAAGFAPVRELYVSPTDLFRVYAFGA
jgi:SAM-dependent methyltransferase